MNFCWKILYVKILVSLKDKEAGCSFDVCIRNHRSATCPLQVLCFTIRVSKTLDFICPFFCSSMKSLCNSMSPHFQDWITWHHLQSYSFSSPHPFSDNLLNSRSFLHLCEYPILSPLPFPSTLHFKLISQAEGFKNLSQAFWLPMSTAYPSCPCALRPFLRNQECENCRSGTLWTHPWTVPSFPTAPILKHTWAITVLNATDWQWFHSHVIHKEDNTSPRGLLTPSTSKLITRQFQGSFLL